MARPLSWLAGAGFGAGLMYYMDPQRGHGRRAQLRDQARHSAVKANRAATVVARDAFHRLAGRLAEARSRYRKQSVSDSVLEERIRSKLGRHVSHPAAVRVSASEGRVSLSGKILRDEIDRFVSAVQSIHGVQSVENELHPTDHSAMPQSHEQSSQSGRHGNHRNHHWSPRARVVAGTAGAALVASSLLRRQPLSVLLGTVGLGLCTRAATNRQTSLWLGRSGGIEVEKSIIINAPRSQVFKLLSDPTNFPRLTDSIRSVRSLGGSQYEKVLAGPGGREIVLHDTLTRCEPNEVLAWKSNPESTLQYCGSASFEALDDRRTRVHVSMTYHPPGGIVSHAAAWLIGRDPKRHLGDLLSRAKSYLETGRQPHDSADHSPINVPVAAGAH